MLINIPKPEPEHKGLLDAMRAACGSNYKLVNAGTFLLQTDKFPAEIAGYFDTIFLDADRYLIVELGLEWYEHGFGTAAGWLNTHVSLKPRY
jgi:hypothetical protein